MSALTDSGRGLALGEVSAQSESALFTLLVLPPSQLFSGCSFCLGGFVCDME